MTALEAFESWLELVHAGRAPASALWSRAAQGTDMTARPTWTQLLRIAFLHGHSLGASRNPRREPEAERRERADNAMAREEIAKLKALRRAAEKARAEAKQRVLEKRKATNGSWRAGARREALDELRARSDVIGRPSSGWHGQGPFLLDDARPTS